MEGLKYVMNHRNMVLFRCNVFLCSVIVVVASSSLVRILGECPTILSPQAIFVFERGRGGGVSGD